MNLPNQYSVFIVDGHPLVRHALAKLIEQQSYLSVVGEADGYVSALEFVKTQKADLVITDLRLRDGCGLQLIKDIRAIGQDTRIMVSTACDGTVYAERAIKAGALGFVSKQDEVVELLHAVQNVINGDLIVSSSINDKLLSGLNSRKQDADGLKKVASLSDRELRVFELIGDGFSTHEIANQLELSKKTIESHRERIKMKLNISSASRLSRQAAEWMISQS